MDNKSKKKIAINCVKFYTFRFVSPEIHLTWSTHAYAYIVQLSCKTMISFVKNIFYIVSLFSVIGKQVDVNAQIECIIVKFISLY